MTRPEASRRSLLRRNRGGTTPGRAARWSARGPRLAWLALVALAAGIVALALIRDGDNDKALDPGPVHVHGLGVNPADAALFIATHTGLFRVGEGERTAVRVGDDHQDTMGFTIVGPERFLGSGHPDLRQDLPPLLGLIESTDAGRTWEPVSLRGAADFHILRYAHGRVYGYDVTHDRLLVSPDEGRSWDELSRPGPLIDFAADPRNSRHLVAVAQGQRGPALFESTTGGERWSAVASLAGLLAWPASDRLYIVTQSGEVFVTSDRGRLLERRGAIGGEPAALLAYDDDLYVALHDGTIRRSTDGGRNWSVHSAP